MREKILSLIAAGLLVAPFTAMAAGETAATVTEPESVAVEPVEMEETVRPERTGPATPTDKIVDRFMELDTDESEGVSFDEFNMMVMERAMQRYSAMDTDEDGEVTSEEYRVFWKAQKAQYYRLKR